MPTTGCGGIRFTIQDLTPSKNHTPTYTLAAPPPRIACRSVVASSPHRVAFSLSLVAAGLDTYLIFQSLLDFMIPVLAPSIKMWAVYNSILVRHPLKTEMATSATLWFFGDILAQEFEHRDKEAVAVPAAVVLGEKGSGPTEKACYKALEEPRFDLHRAGIQTLYAGAIWGVAGHYWYHFLDKQALKYAAAGTIGFVAVKLGLEIALLHPIALLAFFVVVGLLGGESFAEIGKQLRRDYVSTLMLEVCLWTPLDLANFLFVPVRHQLLVVNTACLFESIMLSYIKANGLFMTKHLDDHRDQEGDKKKKL